MAGNGGRRSSAPGNNSSLILGILVGMVLGLVVAGAVAWHISKRPNTFTSKETHEKEQHESTAAAPTPPPPVRPKPAVTAAAPAPAPAPAASGVGDGKPRFEFYQVLTGKEGAPPRNSTHTAASAPAPKAAPRTASQAPMLLQAGSFASADEADRLKAKLALLGMEATVQSANVPGKGTYYRVRLGPYHSTEELNKANSTLKQNGINDAAQVRAQ